METNPKEEIERLNSLADELEIVRAGKQSVAIDYLIDCLRKGNKRLARIECATSCDKLDQPPELRMALAKGLFEKDESTPWGKLGEGLLKEKK